MSLLSKNLKISAFMLAIGGLWASLCPSIQAHHIWVYGEDGKIKVVFGEGLEPDESQYLAGLKSMAVFSDGDQPTELKLTQESDGDQGWFETTLDAAGPAVKLNCPYGVFARGDKAMWLDYSARYIEWPAASGSLKHDANLTLDVIPIFRDGSFELTTTFEGKPAANIELTITPEDGEVVETHSDEVGKVTVALPARYRIMAKKIVAENGEIDSRKFDEKRYYCTVVVDMSNAHPAAEAKEVQEEAIVAGGDQAAVTASATAAASATNSNQYQINRSELELPEFPRAMTSFGAAVIDDQFFIVGGKEGKAHSYAKSYQNRNVYRLTTALGTKQGTASKWETVGECLGLQGVSLVAYKGKLYRIGGLEAKNAEGEDHDLHSVADFVCFNPADGSWTALPNLPAGRSSIDACVIGDAVYVVGGWTMTGNEDSTWCDDMLCFDLSNPNGEWKSIPVPFQTRAMAARGHAGKLIALGGIQATGGPTATVHIYDPETEKWSVGPEIPTTNPMKAFGCSAVTIGSSLLVSGYDGSVLRLSDDGKNWELVGELETGRFFHQMLPLGENSFAVVGGANMKEGGLQEIEVYELQQ